MLDFLKYEYKTLILCALFLGAIFAVYYHLEYRAPEKPPEALQTTCIKPGVSIRGIALGLSAEEVAANLGEKPQNISTDILDVDHHYYEKSGVIVSFVQNKAVSIEFKPEPNDSLFAACHEDAKALSAVDQQQAASLVFEDFATIPYNGWLQINKAGTAQADVQLPVGWIVLPKFE